MFIWAVRSCWSNIMGLMEQYRPDTAGVRTLPLCRGRGGGVGLLGQGLGYSPVLALTLIVFEVFLVPPTHPGIVLWGKQ
jgi:hypothetical protein